MIEDKSSGKYKPAKNNLENGETDMGDKGSKDKGNREKKKKALLTPTEKRKLKREKSK